MITAEIEPIGAGRPQAQAVRLVEEGSPLSWSAFIMGLQRDAGLRETLSQAISRAPFPALFWECRPLSPQRLDEPFGFVLVDSPSLARVSPDPGPFRQQLGRARSPEVRSFESLGGDAIL